MIIPDVPEEKLYLLAYTPKQEAIAIFSPEECVIIDKHLKRHEKMLRTIIYDHWDEDFHSWNEWVEDFSVRVEASRYLWGIYEADGSSLKQILENISESSMVST